MERLNAQIEHLVHFDPSFEKRFQKVIDKALVAVRSGMVSDAAGLIGSDPRMAQKAVRRSVYRAILGGQVNILKKRRAGKLIAEKDIRTSNATQWWRRRGYKTGQMMRYQGSDRGFVLRFLNNGTVDRVSQTMDAHPIKRKSVSERPKNRIYKSQIIGYRGREGNTSMRGYFKKSESRMEGQTTTLAAMIEQLITEEFNR